MRYKNIVLWTTLLCLFISNSSSITKFDSFANCTSKRIQPHFQTRGFYTVFYNYMIASASFKCSETVTCTTHADYTFFDNVETLVDRWNGPVSIAVYAPGEDFLTAVKSIAYLRHCKHRKIRKYVTFHIFFDTIHYPNKVKYELSCTFRIIWSTPI